MQQIPQLSTIHTIDVAPERSVPSALPDGREIAQEDSQTFLDEPVVQPAIDEMGDP